MENCDNCKEKIKLLRGPRGLKGEKGDRGDRGPIGQTGLTGPRGEQGEQGIQGIQGIPGINGSDGAKGDDGNTGVPGEAGVNGDYTEVSNEPAGANCPCGGLKFVVRSGIDNSVLSTSYACNNCLEYGLETFQCMTVIDNLFLDTTNKTFPIVAVTGVNPIGLNKAKIIKKYQIITSNGVTAQNNAGYVLNANVPTCSFGTMDNEINGEFEVTEAGHYLINASCHLKGNNAGDVSWQTTGVGKFGIAILSGINNPNNIFSGNTEAVVESIDQVIAITSTVTTYLAVGNKVRIGLLNNTDRNYDGSAYTNADTIRFSITKIK
jgi:hypothetical protein